MRFNLILMVLIIAAPFSFFGQGKSADLTYYEDQSQVRPMSFEYTNAQNVVHKKWGIIYKSSEGVDTSQVKVSNSKFEEALSQRHGEGWNGKLMGAVKMELSAQSRIRLMIEKLAEYKLMDTTQLYIEVLPKGKKYICKVIGQQVQGDKKPFVIFRKAVYSIKREKLKLKSSKARPIDVAYLSEAYHLGLVK